MRRDSTRLVSLAKNLEKLTQSMAACDASTIIDIVRCQDAIADARRAMADAESTLARAAVAVSAQVRLDLRVVQSSRSGRGDVLSACRRLYLGDPRVFDLNEANCRRYYAPGLNYYESLLPDTASVRRLEASLASAATTADTLGARLRRKETAFDDDLRGKRAFVWALGAAAVTSLVVLAMLLFAHDDVRHHVFRHTQATELVAILVIVLAVIFFGSIKILNGDSVAGLLGGIAGYVLGRQRDRRLAGPVTGQTGTGGPGGPSTAPSGTVPTTA